MKLSYGDLSSEMQMAKAESKPMDALKDKPQFNAIVDILFKRTNTWAEEVGLLKKEEPIKENNLSQREKDIQDYFKNHDLGGVEQTRNIADLVTLLTGLDTGKLVSFKKGKRDAGFFWTHIVVVPIGNTNSHDYPLGKPAYSAHYGTNFVMVNGSHGNTMTQQIKELRVPTRDEIFTLMASIFFRSTSYMEITFKFAQSVYKNGDN